MNIKISIPNLLKGHSKYWIKQKGWIQLEHVFGLLEDDCFLEAKVSRMMWLEAEVWAMIKYFEIIFAGKILFARDQNWKQPIPLFIFSN